MKEYVRYTLFSLFGGMVVFLVLFFYNAPRPPARIERVRIVTNRPPLTYRLPEEITFCDERIPLEKRYVWERLDKEYLLALGNTPQVLLWLKRSNRYFPYIEERLREEELPEDLKYLAVIESDLIQDVRSPVGAAGPWQFMKFTARKMGLRVDSVIDERYDFRQSTDAAIKYLKRLNRTFNSWIVSVAAYNLGITRIQSEMRKQRIDDYYYLELPEETERYVFRAIAAKLILSKPEKFGFILEKDQYYHPIQYDVVDLRIRGTTSLKTIAKASQTYLKTIKSLNPQIRRLYLPPGNYLIKIPQGKMDAFEENFKRSPNAIHVVRKGDNLTKIARRYNVSISQLLRLNGMQGAETIYPGQQLVVARGT
jgi:hypothetical protein